MNKSIKLPKDRLGNAYYPATVTDAIVHPTKKQSLTEIIDNIKDVKIVDSVDKLDLNAERGSLASVAVDTIGEVPFSELHQPTFDEVDFNAGVVVITNLSSVSGISINSSYDASVEIQDSGVYLLSKDIDFQGEVGQMIALVPGEAMVWNFATKEQYQLELFTQNEDGAIIVNEENLDIINNLLSAAEFVYGGVISMDTGESLDPSYADVFYRSIGGKQKTDLYIKDVEGWKVLNNEELKNQISDLEVNLNNLENTVTNLEDKTDLIVNSVDELDPDAPVGTLANVIYKGEPILKPITKLGVKKVIVGDFVGESFIIPEDNFSIVFSASSPMYLTNLSVSYSSDASTVDLYKGVVLGNSNKLCSYKIDTKEITELDQLAIDNLNTNLKNGKLYGSTYVPSGVNEEECYKFFDQFIKNEVGYIPATVYSYTKYESGWEQYDKILKSRNVFNSPDELDANSELGYVCSVVETSNKPRYLPLNNGTVGTLEFGYFNTGEFIDLPADIVNLSISQGFSISGSLPVHTNKLSVTKDLTTNRIIFNFRNYLNNSNPIIEFDISTLSFVQPSPSLLFVAMGNCDFSTSESNFKFLSQFFIQKIYPKVTKLYTKNETGWEQYSELADYSVTTDKVADGAITMDKLDADIQTDISSISNKLNIIEDLEEIRNKANSALQSVPDEYITETELNAKGYITDISGKLEIINDLLTIREGAAKGATALQSVPDEYVTETELNNKGYLTEHLDITHLITLDLLNEATSKKHTSIDFGNNEDSVSLAIMDSNVTITKVKTLNVSNVYISYGDIIKQEINLNLTDQNIILGDVDFIVINITRTADEVNAVVGLTFIDNA